MVTLTAQDSVALFAPGRERFVFGQVELCRRLDLLASLESSAREGAVVLEIDGVLLDGETHRALALQWAAEQALDAIVTTDGDADRPLIEDLSLIAEPGTTVAIVGPTGAGKTTLVNLVMRFYELNSGRITLDGRDISQMARRELRQNIGMVLQDTWLFGGTIRDNIAYGNPSATEEQIRAAAKAAYVDRFVRSLPLGYDTVLDNDGGAVSAGEKQLLTIARAFLADPSILILDEATSSVDTRTEVLIQRAMVALRSQRTSFVIAHRLSTIRDANIILVMEQGSIVEQGSHEDLLAAHGAYYRLYQSQFAGAATDIG